MSQQEVILLIVLTLVGLFLFFGKGDSKRTAQKPEASADGQTGPGGTY
jgi:hypothetical protein